MATKVGNGLDLLNQRILNVGDPSSAQDAATKNYVDAVARGLDWKDAVRAASVGNVTVSSTPANLDGVTLSSGMRVLLKDQSTPAENGIYTAGATGAPLVRALDADSSAEVTNGMAVSVTGGTVNANRVYVLNTADPITLGTTALSFAQVTGGGSTYIAGNGLTESPAGTFNVGSGGYGISITADAIAIDTAVVARKFAANVGDGSSTTITLTHNFNTRDVSVEVWDAATFQTIFCDVIRPTLNTVTLTFAVAPASSAYRAVVIG